MNASLKPEVLAFLSGGQRNAWLYTNDMDVYVRCSRRVHPGTGQVLRCFDIANISVHTPGTGAFSRLFQSLKEHLNRNDFNAIYIESVQNPEFAVSLRKHGLYETPGIDRNFFFVLGDQ